jgi:hypothetical protein
MVHMPTANLLTMPDRGSAMEHPQNCRASSNRTKRQVRHTPALAYARRMVFAAAALLIASLWGSATYAQSGPFAGMAGTWAGGGTVTLDDGSTERIRCRATYAVGAGGNGLQQTLTCASDSYKFQLSSNVVAQGSEVSGTWNEASRNINGNLQGRAGGGVFQIVASAPGFTANLTLTTRGNKQSVVIKAESQFRGASISLSKV